MADALPSGYGTGSGGVNTHGGGLFKGENGITGSSAGDIFRVNESVLDTDVTIDITNNASATGPITVASGITLTVDGTLVVI